MTLAQPAVKSPASSVTPERVLGAPLPDLLADLDVELVASSITDAGFFGAVVRKGGQLYLTMPTGRSELERDTVARYLIAQAFGVGLPQLPEPFVTAQM
jgi:hypothetical protein